MATDRSSSSPPAAKPAPHAALPWNDPASFRAWLRDVDTYTEQLIDVAEDQTDPPGERFYGRAGAREKIDEAAESLRSMLASAKRGDPKEGAK